MYYDVVCSIYEKSCKEDFRVDSHLISGGFKTDDEAMEYINEHDCDVYNHLCTDNQYHCVEIECHNEDGSCVQVITVDY